MTLPLSGPLTLGGAASNSINNEFGYGADLGSYRNKLYTDASNVSVYPFPLAPNSISMPSGSGYSFYGARKIPSGSANYYPGTGSITIPTYNSLTVSVYGPGGGGAGSDGYYSCGSFQACIYAGGGTGGSGPTYFGSYPSLYVGPGGGAPRGSNGYSQNPGWSSGGSGGTGTGGNGGYASVTFTNPVIGTGTVGPTSGSSVGVSIGSGGSGGGGGCQIYNLYNLVYKTYICAAYSSASAGNGGANGFISLSWN